MKSNWLSFLSYARLISLPGELTNIIFSYITKCDINDTVKICQTSYSTIKSRIKSDYHFFASDNVFYNIEAATKSSHEHMQPELKRPRL